ncbi:cysteine metabolism transcriptional regulator CymR [Georgenia halophila]|uniref:Cysteine metabolism transcriptional regulator CymR n=1 Tax=Georgenia halophila TaxID=620889 RepID=A0ABP8KTJ2_9MICO
MHVSAKTDYALRALIEIARAEGAAPLTAEAVGREQEIPRQYLQAILAGLRRAGIVRSQRGQGGGWLLAKEPQAVSVADVMRAVDGPLVSVHGVRPESVTYLPEARVLQSVWIAARGALRGVLESTTLEHLATGTLPPVVEEHSNDDDAWQPR